MANIKWCCKQKDGIRLVEPDDNLALSYLKMADNALGTMQREKAYNMMFAISACYYAMYYALYAILMKCGVKCEIHSCTMEFMKYTLMDFYSNEELKTIKKAFDARIIAQYYADRIVLKEDSDLIMSQAPFFVSKSRGIVAKLNIEKIQELREKIGEVINPKKEEK